MRIQKWPLVPVQVHTPTARLRHNTNPEESLQLFSTEWKMICCHYGSWSLKPIISTKLFSTAVSWTRSCAPSIPRWRESQKAAKGTQETQWPQDGAMAQLSSSPSVSVGQRLLSSSTPRLLKGVFSLILTYFQNLKQTLLLRQSFRGVWTAKGSAARHC